MATFESTLQNSLKEALIEFTAESLCFIISYWIWTQTTELTIYLSQRPQNPSECAGTLSLSFSQVGLGQSTIYWCWHFASRHLLLLSDQNPISQSQPETSESQGTCHNFSQRTKMLIIQYLISLKPWALKDFCRDNYELYRQHLWHRKLFWLVPQFVKTAQKKKCKGLTSVPEA